VFFKQRDMRWYPGWAFAIPTFVMRCPWSLLEATVWSLLASAATSLHCRARLLPLLLLHVQVVLPMVVCRRLGWFAIVRCYLHC
jgi:hypothetical protein